MLEGLMRLGGVAVAAAVALTLTLGAAPRLVRADDGAATPEIAKAYKKHCRKCHGWDGRGQTRMGKKLAVRDYTAAAWQSEVSDERVRTAMQAGWLDPENPKRKMPAFADRITPAQLEALLKVVRSFGTPPGPFPEQAAAEK